MAKHKATHTINTKEGGKNLVHLPRNLHDITTSINLSICTLFYHTIEVRKWQNSIQSITLMLRKS